jgi:predicted peptidase
MLRLPFYSLLILLTLAFFNLRADDFVAKTYTDEEGKAHPYRLLIPTAYDASQKYPVIMFFHGAGERGDDNLLQLRSIGFMASAQNRAKFPCFVVALQCPRDQQWVNMKWGDLSGVRPIEPSDMMKRYLKVLDSVTGEYSIDPQRLYLMGVSMGGYAVWDCITRFPTRFAGAVAAAGGGDESTVTADVAKVPIWAFHSTDDHIVPFVRTQHMVEAMTKAGGNPHFTVYQGLGHVCWGKAFADPELLPWLFAQRLGQTDTVHVDTPPLPAPVSMAAPAPPTVK